MIRKTNILVILVLSTLFILIVNATEEDQAIEDENSALDAVSLGLETQVSEIPTEALTTEIVPKENDEESKSITGSFGVSLTIIG